MRTRFTDLMGCEVPLQMAPMGAMAMYAGRSVGAITTIEPAGALTRDLVAEATALLEA